MSRHLDTSTKAQMAKIMVQYGKPSRSSRKESVRWSSGKDYHGKGNLRKFYSNTVGKSFKPGMFICQPSKRTIPISACGRYQIGRQDREHRTDLENSHGRRWKEMVRDLFWWTRRKLGQNCRNDDTPIKYRIRSPNTWCFQCLWKSKFRKQWTWQEVYPLQQKWRKHRAASPHGDFCKSAQHLRSHSSSVQRIEQPFSHPWEKMSKFLSSEVSTLWNLRTGPMKRLKDRSDVPKAGLGIMTKTYTKSQKKTRLHSTFPRRNGYSRLRQQKSRRKESLWWIQERVCIWVSKKDLYSAELETMRTSRSPTTVMTANGEVQTREEATVLSNSWTYLSKLCFLKKLPQFFPWEALWGSWVYLPLDLRSKTTSHQKWHENWWRYIQLCTICGSWFISEFFLNYTFTSFSIIFITGFRIWCPQIHRKSSTSGSTSEELRGDPLHESTEPKTRIKMRECEEVRRDISHELPDWLQEFRENLVDESTTTEPWEGKPWAWMSRHFKFISWTSNGAASKSGTGFGQAQCIYALSEAQFVTCAWRGK